MVVERYVIKGSTTVVAALQMLDETVQTMESLFENPVHRKDDKYFITHGGAEYPIGSAGDWIVTMGVGPEAKTSILSDEDFQERFEKEPDLATPPTSIYEDFARKLEVHHKQLLEAGEIPANPTDEELFTLLSESLLMVESSKGAGLSIALAALFLDTQGEFGAAELIAADQEGKQ